MSSTALTRPALTDAAGRRAALARPAAARALRLGRAAAVLHLAVAVAWLPAQVTRGAWARVGAPGPTDPASALALVAGAAASLAGLWLLVAVAAAVVDVVRARPVPSRAALLAPPTVRRVVALLVTASLLTPGPANAATTAGDRSPQRHAAVVAASQALPPPAWLPPPGTAADGQPVVRAADGPSVVPAVSHLPAPGWLPTAPPAAPRTAAVVPPLATASRGVADERLEVVVRRGDTLWDIAARHLGPGASDAEVLDAWPAWHAANRDVIGTDPDLLRPGQRLVPPQPSR